MLWFKHYTNASDNAWLNRLENDLGLEAYARWFKILEIIFSIKKEKFSNGAAFRPGFWCRALRFRSVNDCRSFLERLTNDQRIVVEWSPTEWVVRYPKALKLLKPPPEFEIKKSSLELDIELDKEVYNKNYKPKKPTKVGSDATRPMSFVIKFQKLFKESWEKHYGHEYKNYPFSVTGAFFKKFEKDVDGDKQLTEAIERFFSSSDKFYVSSRHSFNVFMSAINALIVAPKTRVWGEDFLKESKTEGKPL